MGRGRAKRDGTHSSGPPPNARSGAWPVVVGLLVLALAVAVGLRVSRRPHAAAGERGKAPRNVLLVTLDTTRADRLGCYGYAGAQRGENEQGGNGCCGEPGRRARRGRSPHPAPDHKRSVATRC